MNAVAVVREFTVMVVLYKKLIPYKFKGIYFLRSTSVLCLLKTRAH
jgi:hypothetical protein